MRSAWRSEGRRGGGKRGDLGEIAVIFHFLLFSFRFFSFKIEISYSINTSLSEFVLCQEGVLTSIFTTHLSISVLLIRLLPPAVSLLDGIGFRQWRSLPELHVSYPETRRRRGGYFFLDFPFSFRLSIVVLCVRSFQFPWRCKVHCVCSVILW